MAREMKDSGIEWIGEIPDGWIIRPLKGVTKRIIVGLATSVTQYYRNNGIPLFRNLNIKDDRLLDDDILFLDEEWASTQTGKMIRAGDILTVHTGYIGISCIVPEQYDNALTFTTLITTPKPDLIDTRFLMRYINVSRFYSPVYFNVETGAQNNLNTKAFINLEICVPDQMEQKRIIAFLDEECSRIDSVIDQTRASIEEYKKLKQAVITQAVTKGIRPDRQMKDSGVEWIGQMPDEWNLCPFRHVLFERNEKNAPVISTERLSLSIELGVTLYAEKTTNLDRFKDDFEQYKIAHVGDLVMNSMNMIVGATGVSPYFGCVSPAYYTFYDNEEDHVTAKYCEYIFRSKTMLRVLFSLGKGIYAIVRGDDRVNTCRLKVSREDLRSIQIPLPSVGEQREIVEYLKLKCDEIDKLIVQKEQIVSYLDSYKKSLIYEYVTGKKEVPA